MAEGAIQLTFAYGVGSPIGGVIPGSMVNQLSVRNKHMYSEVSVFVGPLLVKYVQKYCGSNIVGEYVCVWGGGGGGGGWIQIMCGGIYISLM